MSLDFASLVVGASVGVAGTVLAARINGADQRRRDAWNAWACLNAAVRTGSVLETTVALNLCEIAWAHARVPDEMYGNVATTAWWYQRFFAAVGPADRTAPDAMHEIHQFNVDLMRYYLKRRWWMPPRKRRAHLEALGNEIAIYTPLAEEFLDGLEAHPTG